MLPTWLIEKIEKQEREKSDDGTPLYIPAPMPDGMPGTSKQDRQERGVAEVNFIL